MRQQGPVVAEMCPDLELLNSLDVSAHDRRRQDVKHVVAEDGAHVLKHDRLPVQCAQRGDITPVTHASDDVSTVVPKKISLHPLFNRARGSVANDVGKPIVVTPLFLCTNRSESIEKVAGEQCGPRADLKHGDRTLGLALLAVGVEEGGRRLRQSAAVVDREGDLTLDEGQHAPTHPVDL